MLKATIELAACDRLHSTSGGESDTELKELAVSPTSSPVTERAVTIVTPVANMASDARNSAPENAGVWAWVVWGGVMRTFGIKMLSTSRILPERYVQRCSSPA